MRVCLEATSLLGRRSGVGHTTASLASCMVEADPDVEILLLPLSARGSGRLARSAPDHDRIKPLRTRVPARLTNWVWNRSTWPPAELFAGGVDVFHGPNFVLPPLLKAAGVVTIHDLAFLRVPEMCSEHVRSYERSVPRAASRANRIIVPSAFIAAEVADWLPEEAERIRVVPPGVRDVFLAPGGPLTPPRRDALGLRDPYLCFLGNLERRKNLGLLLEAFERLRRERPGVQLVLAGSPGVGWDDIAEEHADLLASDDVLTVGYLPDREVAALVRGARAFVYPSVYEGFGMPPLEALACGTPVVASDAASLPEALGGHATLVDPGDVEALTAALVGRLDEGPSDEQRQDARGWAESFTWDRAARATLDVYREALEEVRS